MTRTRVAAICDGSGRVWLGSQPYGSPGESYAPCPGCPKCQSPTIETALRGLVEALLDERGLHQSRRLANALEVAQDVLRGSVVVEGVRLDPLHLDTALEKLRYQRDGVVRTSLSQAESQAILRALRRLPEDVL